MFECRNAAGSWLGRKKRTVFLVEVLSILLLKRLLLQAERAKWFECKLHVFL